MTIQTTFHGLQLEIEGINVGKDRNKVVRDLPKPRNLS